MYDYRLAVAEDVREYINENIDLKEYKGRREELEEKLNDELWGADSVTGNASGSYFCNSYKAEEALMHNLDLLVEACEEFGSGVDILKDGAEVCDVTIRCYLLSGCIAEVLDELSDDLEEE